MPADAPVRAAPEIRCVGLAKSYGEEGGRVESLRPIDLVFAGGGTTALVGPSGCGKSTLLRLVAGLEEPSGGSVRIGDRSPDEIRRDAGLAMAFQDASLLPWRTVRGNIALALKLARRPADPEEVDRLIALVGLQGFEERRPGELSGGMRQRVAIARCLVSEPELLLLDEPFGSVDEFTRMRLNFDLPPLWQNRGATTLLVTHSVSEAVLLSDRVIVFSPRPAEVVADIAAPFARAPDPRETMRLPEFAATVEQVSAALWRGSWSRTDVLAAE